jgi:hypothetical protein
MNNMRCAECGRTRHQSTASDLTLQDRRLVKVFIVALRRADKGMSVRSIAAHAASRGLPSVSPSYWGEIVDEDHDRLPASADEFGALLSHAHKHAPALAAAQLAGGSFVPPDAEPCTDIVRGILSVGALTGRLSEAVGAALANDGKIDRDEGKQIADLIDAEIAKLAAMRSLVLA